jgi:hypothetical protein
VILVLANMLIKKKKTSTQMALLKLAISRLNGMDQYLLSAGEPVLSIRLHSLIGELQIVIENSEETQITL